ncbi:glutamine synthetase family protein [Desulfurispora thermophila]|uniref:glutamine synthetase family protein n=1 Tax=Desulfurispora thermophila TaxID=265470 RepID=UPI0003696A0D|nr:glutamine synthetase family protein [Desulfurispora thermophila]
MEKANLQEHLIQHVQNLIQEYNIHTVRLTITDNSNVIRSRFVPARAFLNAIQGGTVAQYPSALLTVDSSAELVPEAGEGFAGGFPSFLLLPDLSTFVVLPWVPGTARVIADIVRPDGSLWEAAPRQVLRRVLERLGRHGYTLKGAFEFEFYVLHKSGPESAHRPVWQGLNCFADSVQIRLTDIFTAIIKGLEGIGAGPEVANTEYGPGQFEITNAPFTGLAVADMAVYYRTSIKEILHQLGYSATFMAKPFPRSSGSGGHFHHSWLNERGENVFYDPQAADGLSPLCRRAIAGQLAHAPAICALANSTINSYKRLRPYYFAPVNASWGYEHRCTMLRVPFARGEQTRLENRLPAADTNPYLAIAACLAAALDGVEKELNPAPPVVGQNPYELSELPPLPDSLPVALAALEKDAVLQEYLGEEFCRNFLALRRREWARFQEHITDWELNEYLELV